MHCEQTCTNVYKSIFQKVQSCSMNSRFSETPWRTKTGSKNWWSILLIIVFTPWEQKKLIASITSWKVKKNRDFTIWKQHKQQSAHLTSSRWTMKFFMSLKKERTVTNISQYSNGKKVWQCTFWEEVREKNNRQGAKKRQQLLQLSEIEMDHEGVVTFSHGKLFVQ